MASSSEPAGAPLEEPQAPPPPNPDPNPSEDAAVEGAEEEEPKTLEHAQELFDRGSKAIEDEDFVDAVDCLSRALEIRTAHYGELAPECASTYYKYGCALLYKAQEETDPLGNVPKSASNEESVKSTTAKDDSESSKASGSNAEDDVSSDKVAEEAITLCKSRIQNLKASKDALLAGKDGEESAAEGGSEKSSPDGEIEQLTGILAELEKKLEDLEQAMSSPSPAMDELMKAIASRETAGQKVTDGMPRAASFTSSQMAASSNGFDSVMSTAATTGSTGSTVTDLGVVGRGVKRANIKPISAEPAPKKPALDSASAKGDSGNSSDALPTTQNGDESVSK
nr:unnamed protein product [Digitaria exilis]